MNSAWKDVLAHPITRGHTATVLRTSAQIAPLRFALCISLERHVQSATEQKFSPF